MKEKLYYPVFASIRYKDCEDYDDIDYWRDDISQNEAASYFDPIELAILRDVKNTMNDSGLMEYFSCDDKAIEKSVKEKVLSSIPSIENVNGELFGVMELEITEPLTNEEMASLKDEITGQLSDGFGEGFEQREIKIPEGDLYVSFWASGNDFFIDTQQEFAKRIGHEMEQDFSDGQSFTQQM